MKSNEVRKNPKQQAAEVIAKKKIRILKSEVKGYGDYAGIGLEWEGIEFRGDERITKVESAMEIRRIEVTVYRDKFGEITYFVEAQNYDRYMQIIAGTKSVEEAFAIKDLLDDMIKAFQEKQEAPDELL